MQRAKEFQEQFSPELSLPDSQAHVALGESLICCDTLTIATHSVTVSLIARAF